MRLRPQQVRFWLKTKFGLNASGEKDTGVSFEKLDDGRIQATATNVFLSMELMNFSEVSKANGKEINVDPKTEEIVTLISPRGIGNTEEESLLTLHQNFVSCANFGEPAFVVPANFKIGQDPSFIRDKEIYRLIRENHPVHDHASLDLYDFRRVMLRETARDRPHHVEFLPFETAHIHLIEL